MNSPTSRPVRLPGVRVVDVGEPLGRRRYVGQLLELGRRDQPLADVAPDRLYFINSNVRSPPAQVRSEAGTTWRGCSVSDWL